MERRTAIKRLSGTLLVPTVGFGLPETADKPVLRVAHLTDIHLKDEFGAPAKLAQCLHHVQRQAPKVDLILNGGDIVFDMNKENLASLNAQWQLLKAVMKAECSLPVAYCLGNHDVWWHENTQGQAQYGKQYALNQLGLAKPYYSFSRDGWKFIVLDSTHLDVDATWYIGRLGDEQFAWLETELKATPAATPVLVLSHIPILTALLMVQDDIVNKWQMLGGDMHTDTAKLIRLFYQHPNVKLCLSGHLHLRDKVVYNQTTYLCNGAVSGAWWKGNNRETAPGYGLLDLYADGRFAESYVTY